MAHMLDANEEDVELEEDGNGVPSYNNGSFAEDEDFDEESTTIDDYYDGEEIDDSNIDYIPDETEEDESREITNLANSIMETVKYMSED
jgi:hypothetical protein